MVQGTSPPGSSLRHRRQVLLPAQPSREHYADFWVLYSRQAIQKYIKANNNLGNPTDAMFKSRVNAAIRKGLDNGDFSFPKGTCTLLRFRAIASKGWLRTRSTRQLSRIILADKFSRPEVRQHKAC